MLVIALTGGIGSGKTTVTEIFKSKNIPIIDTDIIARQIVEPDKPAYIEIIHQFGDSILDENKNINRQKLRAQIFNFPEKRKQLENILHPLIWDYVRSAIDSLQSAISIPYCIIVVPLLFETKQIPIKIDRVLVIDTPESLQIKRTKERDNCNSEQVENIMQAQVSRQSRLKLADDIVVNEGNIESLKGDIESLHQQYINLSK